MPQRGTSRLLHKSRLFVGDSKRNDRLVFWREIGPILFEYLLVLVFCSAKKYIFQVLERLWEEKAQAVWIWANRICCWVLFVIFAIIVCGGRIFRMSEDWDVFTVISSQAEGNTVLMAWFKLWYFCILVWGRRADVSKMIVKEILVYEVNFLSVSERGSSVAEEARFFEEWKAWY